MQPREKFKLRGIEGLTNRDLISIILSTGTKGQDFSTVASKVETKIDRSVSQGLNIYTELQSVAGVGSVKAMKILAGIELGVRLYNLNKDKRVRIFNTQDAWNLLSYIRKYKQERIVAVFLNARYEFIKKQVIAIGSTNRISIKVKDILIPALLSNSTYVVLAHNHPSGDHTPSNEDIEFTKGLKKSFDSIGLYLLDHLVISENGWSRVEI